MGDDPPRICKGKRYDTQEERDSRTYQEEDASKKVGEPQPNHAVGARPSKNTGHTRAGAYVHVYMGRLSRLSA